MTARKQSILDSALTLFSQHGYHGVSTVSIANHAQVSEGLIFKHFRNKRGLLDAFIDQGEEQISFQVDRLAEISTPSERIQEAMEIPFGLPENQFELWRLLYGLKFVEDERSKNLFDPVRDVILDALKDLNYADAEAETYLIMSYIDGFMTTLLLHQDKIKSEELLDALRKKYVNAS